MCAQQKPEGDTHEAGNKEIECSILLTIIQNRISYRAQLTKRHEVSKGVRSWGGNTTEDNERGRGQILVQIPIPEKGEQIQVNNRITARYRARLVRDEISEDGMVRHCPYSNTVRTMSGRDHSGNERSQTLSRRTRFK